MAYGWWRPSRSPSVPLALGARSVGRADVYPGWKHGPGQIHWINFYWGVGGEVGFLADGKRCIDPGRVSGPSSAGNTNQSGYPTDKSGRYRWMTLDGPLAMDIVKNFGFSFFPSPPGGPLPGGIIRPVGNGNSGRDRGGGIPGRSDRL